VPSRSRPAGSPRTAALAWLGRRDYTTRELTDKLRDRGYAHADIESVVRSLTADGLLDDRRAAAAHVRTASKVKGRGRVRIAHELASRGVSGALADELLARLSAEDETEAIRRILTRRRWPSRPTLADRRRMFRHLLRRGFPADAIAKALRPNADDD